MIVATLISALSGESRNPETAALWAPAFAGEDGNLDLGINS